MDYQFICETFDSISRDWKSIEASSSTSPIFASHEWSKTWWQHFGAESKLLLGAVKRAGRTIGIAPLLLENSVASFIGDSNVCDYLDFLVEPGEEETFCKAVLDNLAAQKITRLSLAPLRPDSVVLNSLTKAAERQGWLASCSKEDVTVELDLPGTWEDYLQMLSGKQRHEIKRKRRRLDEEGELTYRTSTDASRHDVDIFLKLFQDSREDKAAFLTSRMEAFFRALATAMARRGLLRLNFLELEKRVVAATMCFDHRDTVYLYNSGYEPDYGWLSVGVISKALCIRDSIERKKKRLDFLKGGEPYKHHLGGSELPLYACSLSYKR
jgi:CelD/BcsL family acetyltransferase involved in cellulose biosynthesis